MKLILILISIFRTKIRKDYHGRINCNIYFSNCCIYLLYVYDEIVSTMRQDYNMSKI